jgi:hypothetical protein
MATLSTIGDVFIQWDAPQGMVQIVDGLGYTLWETSSFTACSWLDEALICAAYELQNLCKILGWVLEEVDNGCIYYKGAWDYAPTLKGQVKFRINQEIEL